MIRLFYLNKYRLAVLMLVVGFTSCEKVIEVEIDESEQVIVMEGVLKDRDSLSYFLISKTIPIYEENEFEMVSGAEIIVSDQNGVDYVFSEDLSFPGHYVNYDFVAKENHTYYLTAEVQGQIITSSSFSKTKPVIDSIGYQLFSFGQGQNQDTVYIPEYYSHDPADEKNFYRLRIWINNEEEKEYYIGNDYYINGQSYDAQFFGANADLGDTVFIEMLEMDEDVYDYFYGLSNTLITGAFSPAPANPPTNLESEGKVTGYFGVFMTDTMSTILE